MRCVKSEVWEWERVTGDVTKVNKRVNDELYVFMCVAAAATAATAITAAASVVWCSQYYLGSPLMTVGPS